MNDTKRSTLILKRWIDITSLTLFTTLSIVYLRPAIIKLAELLQELSDNWNCCFILLAYLIIPFSVGTFLKAIGAFRFKDFDFIYSFPNPPTWYASLFTICLYPALVHFIHIPHNLENEPLHWITILFTSLLFVGTMIGILRRLYLQLITQNDTTELNNQISTEEILKNVTKFIDWLQKEKPVENPEDDLFNSKVTARRITRALSEKPLKTISLIGPYGSGKTSILNMARKELSKQKRRIIISASAWGYEDKKITSYILRNIVRHISNYTDCLNTYLVPLEYQSIFLSNSWGLLNFLKLLFAIEKPECLIRKINDALKRSDLELIIYLEDIDRNQNKNIHHQLYSLFNYFNHMDRISFVVTYGSGTVLAEPLTKITDKTEIVSELSWFTIHDCLVKFRAHCLEKYKDIDVPDFDRKKMDDRIGLINGDHDLAFMLRQRAFAEMGLNKTTNEAINCLIGLLRNPRRLKRALYHTCKAWDKLHGEIYFDDLLVLNTIKVTACGLFHLIANNINQFKMFAHRKTKADNTELYKKVENTLDFENIANKKLYHNLIQFLFPAWQNPDQSNSSRMPNYKLETLHPQGIATDSHINYFARALAEELPENEISDQNVMRLLLNYNCDKYSTSKLMSKIIKSDQFAERIEYFGKLIKPAKVLSLTSEYFKNSNKMHNTNFHNDSLTVRLWRISLDNYETKDNHQIWLERQIDEYLPKSFTLANEIFYFWHSRTREDSSIKSHPPELHEMYFNKVKQFIMNTEQFAKVLTDDMPHIWSLHHRVYLSMFNNEIKAIVSKNNEDFFSNWKPWLAESLMKASIIEPLTIAIYTIPLVYDLNNVAFDTGVEKGGIKRGWKASFDEEIVKMLFGDNTRQIIKLVSILKEDDYKKYDFGDQATTLLDYAVTHSKQWLSNNS